MSRTLTLHQAGPAMTLQDLGRAGHMSHGLSLGGAADRQSFVEGAALLNQSLGFAALEMAGMGGTFESHENIRIALTGAPMRATLEGEPLAWNASHALRAGQRFSIGAATEGQYGYLHVGGGFDTAVFLGSRAAHLAAGIGAALQAGESLAIGPDETPELISLTLPKSARFGGGNVRVLPSVQTALFAPEVRGRFEKTTFHRTARGNRQGAELAFEGAPFAMENQLNILSEPMIAGDIQMTGDGQPYVLLPECQTIGGYPRIASVVPDDLPIVAQAQAGVALRFEFVSHAHALAVHRTPAQFFSDTLKKIQPLLRDPREIRDLLSYQLVGGMVSAQDKPK